MVEFSKFWKKEVVLIFSIKREGGKMGAILKKGVYHLFSY